MRRLLPALALALLSSPALAGAAPPSSPRDLAGIWVAGKALHTILERRSPHAAVAENVTISEGRLTWSNGHEASWRRIVRVEGPADRPVLITGPWEQENPAPKDLVHVPLRLERDAAGKVRSLTFLDAKLVEAHGQPWTRVDEPVSVWLNRRLLAGTYRDAQGRTWKFTPEGKAVWPGQSFSYEVSIDESEADCDYIFFSKPGEVGGTKRYGFRWQKGTLRLYSIAYPEDGAAPIHCEKMLTELKAL